MLHYTYPTSINLNPKAQLTFCICLSLAVNKISMTAAWENFKESFGTCIGYEEKMTEIQEVLEDQLMRLLTREYIIFLRNLLQNHPTIDSSENHMDDDSKVQTTVKELSALGLKIFNIEALRGIITRTSFDGLQWLDTITNIQCIRLCELLFIKLLNDNLIQQVQEANYLLQNALHSLQELGEHDLNQSSLASFSVLIYEKLRPRFPSLREALVASVGCDADSIEKLENTLFKEEGQKPANEKSRRNAFKNVAQKIIGRNIGQRHKQNIVIKNLPPLFIIPKEDKSDITDAVTENEDIGLYFSTSYAVI